MWGDVPLITEPAQNFEEARQRGRESVDVIYEFIIEEAQIAAGEVLENVRLPEQSDNDGRIAISAAHTLLADVFLTLERYQESSDYSKLVIDSGNHELWENYEDAFSLDLQYSGNTAVNGENVFDVKYNPDVDPGNRFASFAWPRNVVLPYAAQPRRRGTGNFEVHESSYVRLDDNDTRKAFMFPFTYALGTGADAVANFEQDTIVGGPYDGLLLNRQNPYFVLKYTLEDPRQRFGNGNNPWPVYRYSDVLLMHLEAMNEIGQADQGTLDLTINRTRARGNLPPLSGISGEALLEEIKQERYTEFFFEGKRFFDLVRWGDLIDAVNNRDFDYGIDFDINENYLLLPIPQREIDANPNITENNPPW